MKSQFFCRLYQTIYFTSLVDNWLKITCPQGTILGDKHFQYISARNGLILGRNVVISIGVKLITANHDLYDYFVTSPSGPIVIGDDTYLGIDVVVLPGVSLGNHSYVLDGTIVSKSFPGNCIIGGTPGEIISYLPAY